jgi:predicted Zn-dependent peptidase
MVYKTHILNNGIRIIHKHVNNGVAHCGLIINDATRDESDDENGIAHFIEHMIFKGTQKRKAFHILSRMENVGGELNAYTTKEETSIYASFLPKYYERAIELIFDIIFHSVFPEKEIKKEKDVVTDEINSYRDNPSEEIYDDFENLLFSGHPMGRNILGTIENVKGFSRRKILDFIGQNYHTDQMVITSVGNIDFEKLKKIYEKYFSGIPENPGKNQRKTFQNYKPLNKIEEREVFLSHGCIGNLAFPMNDKRRLPMVLLNNILGGPGMNSRLNLGVREKYGFTYSIDSQYIPYSDTGVFSIYLGTDKGYMEKSIELVHKELQKLRAD